MYNWQWGVVWEYRQVFVDGTLLTLLVAFLSVAISSVLGLALIYAKRSRIDAISLLATAYINLFRAIPPLALLIWVYYVLPVFTGYYFSAFSSTLIALILTSTPFYAELFRTGIESVPRGQYEAGVMLGMSPAKTMNKIVLPQAFRSILSNYIGYFALILKHTSLASVIGVNELLHSGNILISNTSRPLEIFTIVAAIYVIIILPFLLLADHYQNKLKVRVRMM